MTECAECGDRRAERVTTTGRAMCDDCYRRLVGLEGAGAIIGAGGDLGGAIATGLSTSAFAGSVEGEGGAATKRRAKLDSTTGRWRRLWVRIVG